MQRVADWERRALAETLRMIPNFKGKNHSVESEEIAIPFVFEHSGQVLPGRNAEFDQTVSACDTNKDGKITEAEARIFANQNR